jgi:hypothetical protein
VKLRWICCLVLAAALAGACGGSTPASPSPAVDLTGAWSGMIGQPQSGAALRITWMAAQTGSTVSGPVTLVKPALNVPATGTMRGTLSGGQLTLSFSVPAGAVPIYLSCTIVGTGSAVVTGDTISGTLQTTFTNCLFSGLETPASPQFTLNR